jgi:hypothetical protein
MIFHIAYSSSSRRVIDLVPWSIADFSARVEP